MSGSHIRKYPGGWLADIRPQGYKGQRIIKRFSHHRYPDAKKACQDFVDSVSSLGRAPQSLSLDAAVREYIRQVEITASKSPLTISADKRRFSVILRWAASNGIQTLAQLDMTNIRRFQLFFFSGGTHAGRKGSQPRGNRKVTWTKYASLLSALFRFAMADDRRWVSANPAAAPEFKFSRASMRQQMPRRIFEPEEVTAILEEIDLRHPKHSLYFRMLAYTGCRPGEPLRLTWNLVDLNARVMVLPHTKSGRPLPLVIHDTLLHHFETAKAASVSESVIWPRCTVGRYYRIWVEAQKALDLPQPFGRLYDMRHTFGTTLNLETGQLRVVQEMLGHADISTTEIYTHIRPEHQREAIKKLPW